MAETTEPKRHVTAFRKACHDHARECGVEIETEANHAGVAVRVGRSAVLFDRRFEADDDYRERTLADVCDLIDARAAVLSDDLSTEARKSYTAIALVPVGERIGLYQVAEVAIADGKIASVKRYRKHQPEMGHFALYQAFEALRNTHDRAHDPALADNEDASIELTPETAAILKAPEKAQTSKVKL